MGASDSKTSSLTEEYRLIQRLSSPILGQVLLMSHKKLSQEVLVREMVFQSSSDFQKASDQLSIRSKLSHSNLIRVYKYASTSEKQFCSSFYKLIVGMEYYPKTLMSEIEEKITKEVSYNSDQILSFLKGMISVLAYLQKQKVSHGNIRTNTIFVDKEKYRILEPSCFKGVPGYTAVMTGNMNEGIFLAPELMNSLVKKIINPKYNVFKSDVFVLGIIGLELVLGKKLDVLFDYEHGVFNKESLKEILDEINQKVDCQLSDLLRNMLEVDVQKRPDFINLDTHSSGFENVLQPNANLENKIPQNQINENKTKENFADKENEYIDLDDIPMEKSENLGHVFRSCIPDRISEPNEPIILKKSELVSTIEPAQKQVFSFISPDIQSIIDEYSKGNYQPVNSVSTIENSQISLPIEIPTFKSESQVPLQLELPILSYEPEKNIFQSKYEIPKMSKFSNFEPSGINPDLSYETYEDGSVYYGQKKDNQRHGEGRFVYGDGGIYEGSWFEGKIEGYGTLYYDNGNLAYQGEWKDDKFNGKGVLYNMSPSENYEFNPSNFENVGDGWIKYEGNFVEDFKEGEGSLYFVNGDILIGKFLKDYVHGKGLYYKKNGDVISGEWYYNVLLGRMMEAKEIEQLGKHVENCMKMLNEGNNFSNNVAV